MSYVERVAARAGDLSLSRVILSAVAFPFYVLGFVLGLLLAAVLWSWSAVAVGISDARTRQVGMERLIPAPEPPTAGHTT